MRKSRREFLGQGAALAALGVVSGGGTADARLVERARDWDPAELRKKLQTPARHRLAFDCTSIKGGTFLNNIKNAMNGYQFGFGIDPADVSLVAALHGAANLVSFDDAMWAKYELGALYDVVDPKTGGPAQRNVFYARTSEEKDRDPDSERGFYQDKSVEGLQARGVDFFT